MNSQSYHAVHQPTLPPIRWGESKGGLRFRFSLFAFSLFVLASLLFAQAINTATDYEWELQVPGRTLFRDRTPIGKISFVKQGARTGLLGKKQKLTGEALSLITDVAFVPGDTIRYFGAMLELTAGNNQIASAVMDGEEVPALWSSLKYMLETGEKIRNTERTDTRMSFRGKSGWLLTYYQAGTQQSVEISLPVKDKEPEIRSLTRDELSALKDLVDLALFDLKRQGAQLAPVTEK